MQQSVYIAVITGDVPATPVKVTQRLRTHAAERLGVVHVADVSPYFTYNPQFGFCHSDTTMLLHGTSPATTFGKYESPKAHFIAESECPLERCSSRVVQE